MNIVLTCVGKFQEYILENICQLLLLGHSPESIYVITEPSFFREFGPLNVPIHLINVFELPDTYTYRELSHLDSKFRDAFWVLTSARFFYIYECMRKYNIENVIHLENDVLIYYNVNVLNDLLHKDRIYMPFDTYSRNIASIVFIPHYQLLEPVLSTYDFGANDMQNFAKHLQSGIVDTFPIFKKTANSSGLAACAVAEERSTSEFDTSEETQFVSRNYAKHDIFIQDCVSPENCEFATSDGVRKSVKCNYSNNSWSTTLGEFPYIFDAAAMGQYLGGVDPRNIGGDTRGFVNETCVIKYDQYAFVWSNHQTQTELYQPFLVVNDQLLPIFNLHIHSKTLNRFTSDSYAPFYNSYFTYHSNLTLVNPVTPDGVERSLIVDGNKFVYVDDTISNQFDVMVPVGPDDVGFLEKHIHYIRTNVLGFRNIYLIIYDDSIHIPGCITISESLFPFTKLDIATCRLFYNREGWYLQQLLKMYALRVIPGILENMLVIDSDTCFLRPIHFLQGGKSIMGYSQENHTPYFVHSQKLHPTFIKTDPHKSGIVHYMMYCRKYLNNLMDMVEKLHKKPFWVVFLEQVDPNEQSGASEYEMYFHFMLREYPDQIELRNLRSKWVLYYSEIHKPNIDVDVISCHAYSRRAEV